MDFFRQHKLLSTCADFNFNKIFLTSAVPPYIQCIQVNKSEYLRVTQSRKNTFKNPFLYNFYLDGSTLLTVMVGFTVFAFRSSCAMFSFMFATLTSLVVSWVPHTMNISSMVSVLATPSIICSISARVAPDFLRILMGLPLDVLSTRTVPHKQCHWSPNRWRRRRRLDACLSLFLLADLVFLGSAHSTRRQAVGSIVRV